jgi:peptidoglycan/xylan/chitin deacetylase (PgdA/CDA1 family)
MSAFTIALTHDVDRVRKTFQYLTRDVRRLRLGGLRRLLDAQDPYWTFPHLMRLEESLGVRSTFFFLDETMRARLLSPSSWTLALGRYRVNEPHIADVMRALDRGGWEVALHGSYESYRDATMIERERLAIEREIGRGVLGIRQHYLNLDVPDTWRHQRAAGLRYDTTFGKRNDVGFRDGRVRPFRDDASGMCVIPLALMDGYLFERAGGNTAKAWDLARNVLDVIEREHAVCSVLWHPHVFYDPDFPGWGEIYERLVLEGRARGGRFVTCAQIYNEWAEIT